MTTFQTTIASAWRSAFIDRIWSPRRWVSAQTYPPTAAPTVPNDDASAPTALTTTCLPAECTMCDGESVDALYRRFTARMDSTIGLPDVILIDLRSVAEADTKLVGCLVAMLSQARVRRIRLVFVLSAAVVSWLRIHRLHALFVENARSVASS